MAENEKKCADCCGDGSCCESKELSGAEQIKFLFQDRSANLAEIETDHTHKVCCDGKDGHCCS